MKGGNDQPIGAVIRAFFEENPGIRQKILEVRAERAWGEVCGPAILRYTRNLFMKGTVLHVSLSSAVLRNELLLSKSHLIDALNKAVQATAVTDIQFH